MSGWHAFEPTTLPRFEALLTLTSTEDGGRRMPVHPGYRPSAIVDGEYHDVAIYFDADDLPPGGSILVRCYPFRTDFWRAVFVGESVAIREGRRTIGRLTVTSTERMR